MRSFLSQILINTKMFVNLIVRFYCFIFCCWPRATWECAQLCTVNAQTSAQFIGQINGRIQRLLLLPSAARHYVAYEFGFYLSANAVNAVMIIIICEHTDIRTLLLLFSLCFCFNCCHIAAVKCLNALNSMQPLCGF